MKRALIWILDNFGKLVGCALLLVGFWALVGCTTVQVRPPPFQLPAMPAELLVPCEDPIIPTEATLAALYENAIQNAVGPWGRCVRKVDSIIQIEKYREAAAAAIREYLQQQNEKPWWKFW